MLSVEDAIEFIVATINSNEDSEESSAINSGQFQKITLGLSFKRKCLEIRNENSQDE